MFSSTYHQAHYHQQKIHVEQYYQKSLPVSSAICALTGAPLCSHCTTILSPFASGQLTIQLLAKVHWVCNPSIKYASASQIDLAEYKEISNGGTKRSAMGVGAYFPPRDDYNQSCVQRCTTTAEWGEIEGRESSCMLPLQAQHSSRWNLSGTELCVTIWHVSLMTCWTTAVT